jgi:hypothetical protein
MNLFIAFIVVLIFLFSCNQINDSTDVLSEPAFILTDTLGEHVRKFNPGEEFVLNFSLKNTTTETLTFYRGSTAPDVVFRIIQDDRVLASSIDGYGFLMVVSQGKLPPGKIMRNQWRAPTTPEQHSEVILNQGTYSAVVSFPEFNETEVQDADTIGFQVVE